MYDTFLRTVLLLLLFSEIPFCNSLVIVVDLKQRPRRFVLCNVTSERINIHVLFTMLYFVVDLDVSILRVPLAATVSPFVSPLNPLNP